jgi:hypothetical protein
MIQEVLGTVGLGRQGDDSVVSHGYVVKGWKKLTGSSSGGGLGVCQRCRWVRVWAGLLPNVS